MNNVFFIPIMLCYRIVNGGIMGIIVLTQFVFQISYF